MASRGRDGPRIRSGDTGVGAKTARKPRQPRPPPEEPLGSSGEPGEDAVEPARERELPRWMKLYLYGMHGVTLDVFLSALRSFYSDRDPKLVGFSSPYLCVVHALTHFALEKIYAQKKCFRHRPAVFHLVFYPSVFIGLQILIGNIGISLTDPRVVSATQLAVHYVLSLYFSQVFHRGLSRLHYNPHPQDLLHQVKITPTGSVSIGGGCLPGVVRFLFFGMHGFLDEVVFTSAFDLVERRDVWRVSGHTSLWSFLVYGTCAVAVERLYLRLHFARGWSTLRRLPVYTGLIYLWELCWGLALRQIGACPWDYSHYPLNFMGLITLLYLPGWVCLSLYQDGLFNILLRVRCTQDDHDEEGDDHESGANDDQQHRHGVNGKKHI